MHSFIIVLGCLIIHSFIIALCCLIIHSFIIVLCCLIIHSFIIVAVLPHHTLLHHSTVLPDHTFLHHSTVLLHHTFLHHSAVFPPQAVWWAQPSNDSQCEEMGRPPGELGICDLWKHQQWLQGWYVTSAHAGKSQVYENRSGVLFGKVAGPGCLFGKTVDVYYGISPFCFSVHVVNPFHFVILRLWLSMRPDRFTDLKGGKHACSWNCKLVVFNNTANFKGANLCPKSQSSEM